MALATGTTSSFFINGWYNYEKAIYVQGSSTNLLSRGNGVGAFVRDKSDASYAPQPIFPFRLRTGLGTPVASVEEGGDLLSSLERDSNRWLFDAKRKLEMDQ